MSQDAATSGLGELRGPSCSRREAQGDSSSRLLDPQRALVDRITSGDFSDAVVLKKREEGLTCRAKSVDLGSVIVKLWSRPKWRHALRRLSGSAPAQLEWAAAERLYRAGLPVPKPLAAFRVRGTNTNFTDAHLVEDLGDLVTVQDQVKAILGSGNEAALSELEDQLMSLTCKMVSHGVLDTDHSLLNLSVTPTKRLVRIDFELARCVRNPKRHPALLGGMVGRLVVSYAFTLQPHVERAERLASQLVSRLQLSPAALEQMRATVELALERQLKTRGIATKIRLPQKA